MTKELERIEYTVYRGHLEPIIEQRSAHLIFYTDYIEIIEDYSFKVYLGDDDSTTAAYLISKRGLDLMLTMWYRDDDPVKTPYPKVEIITSGLSFYVKTMKEAEFIYNKIKEWLLK